MTWDSDDAEANNLDRFWRDFLNGKAAEFTGYTPASHPPEDFPLHPIWRSTCPACVGRGLIMIAPDYYIELYGGHVTIQGPESCCCCDGMGSVLYRSERRAA